jgi:hypothetical protein
MVFTFYKARGYKVGSSLVEEDKLDLAKKLEEMAKQKVRGTGADARGWLRAPGFSLCRPYRHGKALTLALPALGASTAGPGRFCRVPPLACMPLSRVPVPGSRPTAPPRTAPHHPIPKGVELLLPTDVVIADKFDPNANTQVVAADAIPDGWMGLDIGPDSLKTFQKALGDCKTVVWNGPMGVFEFDKFAKGTIVSRPRSSWQTAGGAGAF